MIIYKEQIKYELLNSGAFSTPNIRHPEETGNRIDLLESEIRANYVQQRRIINIKPQNEQKKKTSKDKPWTPQPPSLEIVSLPQVRRSVPSEMSKTIIGVLYLMSRWATATSPWIVSIATAVNLARREFEFLH